MEKTSTVKKFFGSEVKVRMHKVYSLITRESTVLEELPLKQDNVRYHQTVWPGPASVVLSRPKILTVEGGGVARTKMERILHIDGRRRVCALFLRVDFQPSRREEIYIQNSNQHPVDDFRPEIHDPTAYL